MVEQLPSSEPGAEKRRSTRVMQAVPLTVTGVDALGQPFKERTSTLIISCHGCKYQSRHYVLKNSIVTLEVPHPEAGREPRQVQGRVTWILRPRTTRELFQIGIELLVAGNAWGVAFPPEDWFPYPEEAVATLPAPTAEPPAAPPELPTAAEPPAAVPVAPPVVPESKVREMPSPGVAELSATLKRQMERLLGDARQQIQESVRETTASAVAAETAQLLRELNAQLQQAAARAVEAAAASYTDELARRATQQIEEVSRAKAGELDRQWTEQRERDLHESSQQLLARLAGAGEESRKNFTQQLEADLARAQEHEAEIKQRLKHLQSEIGSGADALQTGLATFQERMTAADARLAALRGEIDASVEAGLRQWQERLQVQGQEGRASLEQMEASAKKLHEQMSAAAEQVLASLREQLTTEMGAAGNRWNEQVEASLGSFARSLAERLAEISQTAAASTEQDIAGRAAAIRKAFEDSAKEAHRAAGALRSSLEEELVQARATVVELEAAASRVQDFSTHLEQAGRQTTEELNRRFAEMLEARGAELNQRAESAVQEMTERLEPAFAAAGDQAVDRLVAQAEQALAPHLESAQQAAERLSESEKRAEEVVRAQPERLRQASELYLRQAVDWMQKTVAQVQKDFGESSRQALAKSLEELDAKSTDATHTTFEALYKAAEWYQKKAQTSMQTALDKGVEQATSSLREKAAEVSTLFAAELDHYSRSYVEHTRGLLEEAGRDQVGRTRQQLGEAAETTAATFGDEVHQIADQKLHRFAEASRASLEETQGQLDGRVREMREKADAHAGESFAQFQRRMEETLEKSVEKAHESFEISLVSLMDAWRADREQQQRDWQETLLKHGNESVEAYKERLQNVSNSWMVASVTALNQHSQTVMNTLAKSAEQRLRETYAQAFTGLAETMRQRLLEVATEMQTGKIPPEKK